MVVSWLSRCPVCRPCLVAVIPEGMLYKIQARRLSDDCLVVVLASPCPAKEVVQSCPRQRCKKSPARLVSRGCLVVVSRGPFRRTEERPVSKFEEKWPSQELQKCVTDPRDVLPLGLWPQTKITTFSLPRLLRLPLTNLAMPADANTHTHLCSYVLIPPS